MAVPKPKKYLEFDRALNGSDSQTREDFAKRGMSSAADVIAYEQKQIDARNAQRKARQAGFADRELATRMKMDEMNAGQNKFQGELEQARRGNGLTLAKAPQSFLNDIASSGVKPPAVDANGQMVVRASAQPRISVTGAAAPGGLRDTRNANVAQMSSLPYLRGSAEDPNVAERRRPTMSWMRQMLNDKLANRLELQGKMNTGMLNLQEAKNTGEANVAGIEGTTKENVAQTEGWTQRDVAKTKADADVEVGQANADALGLTARLNLLGEQERGIGAARVVAEADQKRAIEAKDRALKYLDDYLGGQNAMVSDEDKKLIVDSYMNALANNETEGQAAASAWRAYQAWKRGGPPVARDVSR